MKRKSRRKRKRKNILESFRIGNFSLTKSIFLLVSVLLVISYLIANLGNMFTGQIDKEVNLDVWDRIFSSVIGMDAKWNVQKDGRIKIDFPYQRADKERKIIEEGSHIFYISPKFSNQIPIKHEIRRNMRDGSSRVEKGDGYISISEGKTFLQRGDINTVIKRSGKQWKSEHKYHNKSLKQKGNFDENGRMVIQDIRNHDK
ncbi:MAG: hypothetical protein HQ537_00895 [Parcubacteria group bacterium]|nr:hypothetical protein [Parcubacteria group bacterium]